MIDGPRRPYFARPIRVSSSVDLVVAALGLGEVQSLIRAMRTADQKSGTQSHAAGGIGSKGLPAEFSPVPVGRRRVIHPEPRYAPRRVIHPQARVEACRIECQPKCPPAEPIVIAKCPSEQPLDPPWKHVPWENPLPSAPKIKPHCYHPDIFRKGMLVDVFI